MCNISPGEVQNARPILLMERCLKVLRQTCQRVHTVGILDLAIWSLSLIPIHAQEETFVGLSSQSGILDSGVNRSQFRSVSPPLSPKGENLSYIIENHHEAYQRLHCCRFVTLAAQLVTNAVETFRGSIEALPACPVILHNHRSPPNQALEHGRDDANTQTCACRNLPSACRLPQIDQCDIDAALIVRQRSQMVAKVLGVLVNQTDHVVHQSAK